MKHLLAAVSLTEQIHRVRDARVSLLCWRVEAPHIRDSVREESPDEGKCTHVDETINIFTYFHGGVPRNAPLERNTRTKEFFANNRSEV